VVAGARAGHKRTPRAQICNVLLIGHAVTLKTLSAVGVTSTDSNFP